MGEYLLHHARNVISTYLEHRPWRLSGDEPENGPAQGCFVSLKAAGRLRGCIGTLLPRCDTLLEEVADNALGAAFRDPRFAPLRPAELAEVTISIDLLSPLEPVAALDALDPARYGLVVRHGRRCGVLLPGIAGVDSAALQLALCREKAGIADTVAQAALALERFTVTRVQE